MFQAADHIREQAVGIQCTHSLLHWILAARTKFWHDWEHSQQACFSHQGTVQSHWQQLDSKLGCDWKVLEFSTKAIEGICILCSYVWSIGVTISVPEATILAPDYETLHLPLQCSHQMTPICSALLLHHSTLLCSVHCICSTLCPFSLASLCTCSSLAEFFSWSQILLSKCANFLSSSPALWPCYWLLFQTHLSDICAPSTSIKMAFQILNELPFCINSHEWPSQVASFGFAETSCMEIGPKFKTNLTVVKSPWKLWVTNKTCPDLSDTVRTSLFGVTSSRSWGKGIASWVQQLKTPATIKPIEM